VQAAFNDHADCLRYAVEHRCPGTPSVAAVTVAFHEKFVEGVLYLIGCWGDDEDWWERLDTPVRQCYTEYRDTADECDSR
jgi:hypothetical protein